MQLRQLETRDQVSYYKLIEVELPRALRRVEPSLLADVPAIVARVADTKSTR
jgi:hypothetical protein